ncbi:MAG: hypothetical protein EYC62_09590 [Alphaproteobacteria bacterium]|nr:MAG: hypothetical protein EYC62_09590 [Alphaproteobacteria bacterium]
MPYHQSMLGTKLLCGLAFMTASQTFLPKISSYTTEPARASPAVRNVVYVLQNSDTDKDCAFAVESSKTQSPMFDSLEPIGATVLVKFAIAPQGWAINSPVKYDSAESGWPVARSLTMLAGLAGLAAARRMRQ